jgi:hypothetical protein
MLIAAAQGGSLMTEFYRAGFQLVKVRAVLLASLVGAAAACWYGWDLLLTFGERPADGGALKPFVIRLLFGGFVALLGLAFAFGMWIYCRRYVSSMAYDPGAGRLVIRTPLFIGNRTARFALADIKGTTFHRGDFYNPVGVSVDAPWHALEIKGRRAWYIIDAQGRWLDPELAEKLLKPKTGAAPARGRGRARRKRTGEAAGGAESSGR